MRFVTFIASPGNPAEGPVHVNADLVCFVRPFREYGSVIVLAGDSAIEVAEPPSRVIEMLREAK